MTLPELCAVDLARSWWIVNATLPRFHSWLRGAGSKNSPGLEKEAFEKWIASDERGYGEKIVQNAGNKPEECWIEPLVSVDNGLEIFLRMMYVGASWSLNHVLRIETLRKFMKSATNSYYKSIGDLQERGFDQWHNSVWACIYASGRTTLFVLTRGQIVPNGQDINHS